MNLKYVKNLTDKEATMLIYREIGAGYGIDGASFAEELNYLQNRVPLINVRINSPGGSVFDGFSIFSAMRESKATVNTYNDYLAASMGGIIFQAGKTRYAADNSLTMLHNPHGGGETSKDIEILGKIKNSLIDVFVARTGKDAAFISDLMDRESWVEARAVNGVSPVIEMGLADKIFKSSIPVDSTPQVFNAKRLYSISNNIINKKEMENEKLEKELAEIKASLDSIKKDNDSLKSENDALKKEIEEKNNVLKEVSDKAAVELVENAIKDGKIKAELKDKFIENAKKSFDVVKDAIDSIAPATASRFSNFAGSKEKKEGDEKDSWTYKDWENKAPKELTEMYKNDRKKYDELLDNWKKNK